MVISAVAVGLILFAQMALGTSQTSDNTTGSPVSTSTPIVTQDTTTIPLLIRVNPDGTLIMRGTVVSVGPSSLIVRSRGGSWTIQMSSSTKIVGKAASLTSFATGDFVGVAGTISELTDWTVDAGVVRYWGKRADNDRDGIPNIEDQDDDNDGIKDGKDGKPFDHDNDDINDIFDLDDDNDGLNDDRDLYPFDHDNDGDDDDEDEDDDNDGKNDDENKDDDENKNGR